MGLDNIRLGKRIKAARKRIGLSQLVLSEALDCTPNHLSYIENGNRSLSLAKLCSSRMRLVPARTSC